MTATELTKRFPEASKELYYKRGLEAGYTAGQQAERETREATPSYRRGDRQAS